ncbi:MAG: hypothetical protein P8L32_00275, partial [Paracoccaceae bacterium]|nr:hypothetical protein [Paracoccaceae bacterium]
MSDGVSFHVENDVAWVGLSDHGPSVLTRNFAVSLDEALTKVAGNSAIKLVVLSGTPKGFVRGY